MSKERLDAADGARIRILLEAILNRLDALTDRTEVQRFMGVKSAAAYADLSEDSVRELIRRGDLTDYRPLKGKILLDREQLDRLVLGSTTRPRTGRGISRR